MTSALQRFRSNNGGHQRSHDHPGADPGYSVGGRGCKRLRAPTHNHKVRSLKSRIYGRGPGHALGPMEALRVSDALSCYLSLNFKHSDTKWDFKKTVDNFFGGRLLRPPPPVSIRLCHPGTQLRQRGKSFATKKKSMPILTLKCDLISRLTGARDKFSLGKMHMTDVCSFFIVIDRP